MATRYGTAGPDTLTGKSTADTLWGRAGDDTLKGLAGADRLYGEGGDDLLLGGTGGDRIDGGPGTDRASWYQDGGTRGVTVDLALGKATRGTEKDTLVAVEDLTGSTYADTLLGNDAPNLVRGSSGNDVLKSRGGDDQLDGGRGVDDLTAGPGWDTFVLRAGDGGADRVRDFEDGIDQFDLDGLSFTDLRIDRAGTTASRISVARTSEAIAIVDGVTPDDLTGIDFGIGFSGTVLDEVPSYYWYHGCSPTAGGSIIGYWDQRGYDGLFDASGWSDVRMTYNVADQISSPAHNDKYDPKPDDPTLPDPPDTSIADFMHTSEGALDMGYTYVTDIGPGLAAYAGHRGASFESATYSAFAGFGWDDLVTSIDAGHPLLFSVDTDGDGGVDHTVPVFGYDDRGAEGRFYAFNTTWEEAEHVAWEEFLPTSPGERWGVGVVSTFEPAQVALAGEEIDGRTLEGRGPAVGPGLPPEDWRPSDFDRFLLA